MVVTSCRIIVREHIRGVAPQVVFIHIYRKLLNLAQEIHNIFIQEMNKIERLRHQNLVNYKSSRFCFTRLAFNFFDLLSIPPSLTNLLNNMQAMPRQPRKKRELFQILLIRFRLIAAFDSLLIAGRRAYKGGKLIIIVPPAPTPAPSCCYRLGIISESSKRFWDLQLLLCYVLLRIQSDDFALWMIHPSILVWFTRISFFLLSVSTSMANKYFVWQIELLKLQLECMH